MSIIAPSLLAADFLNIGGEAKRFADCGAKTLHLDIMDGQFVPNMTFGWNLVSDIRPLLPGVTFDVHLMVKNPLVMIDPFCDAGADMITIHAESDSDISECLDAIERRGVRAGISIKPGTPVESVYRWLPWVSLVLVMTVEPGFGGQVLMQSCVDKIPLLRAEAERQGRQSLLISVDGGVNEENCADVAAAGANILVAGSAVFGQQDMTAAFRTLSDKVAPFNN